MLITGLNDQGQSTQYLQNELCVMPSFQNVRRRHSCCVGCSMGIIMTRKKQCVVVLLQAQYLGAYLHSQVPFASVCSTCSGLQRGCQRKVSEHPKKIIFVFELQQPNLLKISQIILSYHLADCFEIQGRQISVQPNINKYSNQQAQQYGRII